VKPSEVMEKLGEYQELGQEIYSLPEKFDSALVAVGWRFKDGPLAVYDKNKVIGILDAEMGEEGEEWGEEFFDFNVIGSWIGDSTPVFIEL
tara:strand:+ start:271 stop:543 length:273 start_codon:yes stop_codon:yes gene_type:complete